MYALYAWVIVVAGLGLVSCGGAVSKAGSEFSAETKALFERAEAGDTAAQFNLGLCYYNGQGVEPDLAEAVKWFRLAAEQGHTWAQLRVLQ